MITAQMVTRVTEHMKNFHYRPADANDIVPNIQMFAVNVLEFNSNVTESPAKDLWLDGVFLIEFAGKPIERIGNGPESVVYRPVFPSMGNLRPVPLLIFSISGFSPDNPEVNEIRYFVKETVRCSRG